MRWAGALAILQAMLAVSRLTGLWPCAEACAGGGFYRFLGGVDVVALALLADVGVAVLCLARARFWAMLAAWTLVGVGAAFTAIAIGLGLFCPFCLVHHGLGLIVAGLLWPARWWIAPLACSWGALATNAVFHHQPVVDVAEPAMTAPEAVNPPVAWRGPADAQIQVETVADPSCAHCAAVFNDLRRVLEQSGVRWRVIVPVRPSQPASADLAAAAQQAAAEGPAAMDGFWLSALGLKADATTVEILTLRPELARWFHRPSPQVALDQARLKSMRFAGRTPLIVARRGDGTPVGRWEGDLDLPAIAATLRR